MIKFKSIPWNGGGQLEKIKINTYKVFLLDKSHYHLLVKFQKLMAKANPNREIYQLDPNNLIRSILKGQGFIHGVVHNNKLIAYQMVLFPKGKTEHLGYDLKLNKHERSKLFQLETIYVHPDYRGKNIQIKLHEFAIKRCKHLGFRYAAATISPLNYWSLKNAINKAKLKIHTIKKKYSNNTRFILMRDLEDNRKLNTYKNLSLLSVDQFKEIKQKLQSGSLGILINGKSNNYKIKFASP